MNEIVIHNWDEFEEKVKGVYLEVIKLRNDNPSHVSDPLFRGHSDKGWELKSTLDRIKEKTHINEYCKIIRVIKSSVESCTSNIWPLQSLDKEIEGIDQNIPLPSMEDYQFMTYLRHNGFPSPLLDWTSSPYIAAFFAFNEAKDQDVAIFMYIEYTGQAKSWICGDARICSMGPNVTTHKRHHLQQSRYTFCLKEDNHSQKYYTNHEDAFAFEYKDQDLLRKYVIPVSQKSDFMGKLHQMNINAYSLFETEEGLMNKLSNEQFILK